VTPSLLAVKRILNKNCLSRNFACHSTLTGLHDVPISVRHGDAGDAVASPKPKNWPLFGQKFSTFGQSIQLHSRVNEVVSILPTKAK